MFLSVVSEDSQMSSHRYVFKQSVPMSAVESSLILALWSCESLHGEARVQMDALYEFQPEHRHLIIDSGTVVGQDLNKLFTGLMQREFGHGALAVVRLSAEVCGTSTGAVP